MIHDLALSGKKLANKGLIVQALVGMVLGVVAAFFGITSFLSVAAGVIAFIVPQSVFAYLVFKYSGATKNHIVAQSMNQGMKLKLVLTSLIFVIAFIQLHAHPLLLLGAYAITMMSQWAAMVFLSNRS